MTATTRCGLVALLLAACSSGGGSKAPHAPSTSDAQSDGGASTGHDGHTQQQADSGSPSSARDAATTPEHKDAGDASSAIDTVPWHGSTTPFAAGSWHKERRIDQGSSAGGFGSASYSPAGDLYVFYSAIAAPESCSWSGARALKTHGRRQRRWLRTAVRRTPPSSETPSTPRSRFTAPRSSIRARTRVIRGTGRSRFRRKTTTPRRHTARRS